MHAPLPCMCMVAWLLKCWRSCCMRIASLPLLWILCMTCSYASPTVSWPAVEYWMHAILFLLYEGVFHCPCACMLAWLLNSWRSCCMLVLSLPSLSILCMTCRKEITKVSWPAVCIWVSIVRWLLYETGLSFSGLPVSAYLRLLEWSCMGVAIVAIPPCKSCYASLVSPVNRVFMKFYELQLSVRCAAPCGCSLTTTLYECQGHTGHIWVELFYSFPEQTVTSY